MLTVLEELVVHLVEGDDLSGAHEGEVEGVEEEHDIFSRVIVLADSLE